MKPLTYRERVELRVAAADQIQRVQDMAALPGVSMAMAEGRHPWFVHIGETVLQKLTSADGVHLCPHIGRRPEPIFAVMGQTPLRFECRLCFASRPRLTPIEDSTCDRCSTYTRSGLYNGVVPIGPLMVLFGLCDPCAADVDLLQRAAS